MTDRGAGGGRRAVVLADVARLAEVSIGTASKALNGTGRLRDETRQRVEEAARSLHFEPNLSARGLLQGRTGTVGLLTNDLVGRFSLPILMGAEDALGAGNLSILLCDARGDAIREQFHLRALLQRRVDGIIVVGDSAEVRGSLGQSLPVPVVYAYSRSADPRDVSVVFDDVGAGRIAGEHLLALGRSRLAYLGGDPDYRAAQQRSTGVRAALEASGFSLVTLPLFGPWTEEWGRVGARMLLEKAPSLDAIVCGSDQIARGALDHLRDAGKEVPTDVAVIGHDNWEPIAAHSRPPLTSVDMNLEALGKRAAELLFSERTEDREHVEVISGRVITRASTFAGR